MKIVKIAVEAEGGTAQGGVWYQSQVSVKYGTLINKEQRLSRKYSLLCVMIQTLFSETVTVNAMRESHSAFILFGLGMKRHTPKFYSE